MTDARLMGGLLIFIKYGEHEVAAEHDLLYAGPSPDKVSEADKKALKEMGWIEEEEHGCFMHFI